MLGVATGEKSDEPAVGGRYGKVGEGAVAAPFTTALAGFLLAGEALKTAAGADYNQHRLGPLGMIATQYLESPWASPADAFLQNPPRWPTHECLCQNGRRLALIRVRYGSKETPGGR